jgi:hypothetical protein
MPAKVGIHAFAVMRAKKAWMPTFVGVTVGRPSSA